MLYCCQETELFYGTTFLQGVCKGQPKVRGWNESAIRIAGHKNNMFKKLAE
jgi:hypothetical protein